MCILTFIILQNIFIFSPSSPSFLRTFALMENTSNISTMGVLKPSPEVIKIRLRQWVKKKYHCDLASLKTKQRHIVVWCLHDRFQFSNVDIASTLSVTKRTIVSDIQATELHMKIYSYFPLCVNELEDYLLYWAKYFR